MKAALHRGRQKLEALAGQSPVPAPVETAPEPPKADQAKPERSPIASPEKPEAVVKSVARNVSGQLTRDLTRSFVRGILGSLSKGLR